MKIFFLCIMVLFSPILTIASSIDLLPDYIIKKVMSNLSYKDLLNSAQVNKQWNYINETEELWQKLIEQVPIYRIPNQVSSRKNILLSHHQLVKFFIDNSLSERKGFLKTSVLSRSFWSFVPEVTIALFRKLDFLNCFEGEKRQEAHNIIEILVSQGNQEAISKKIRSAIDGKFRYQPDILKARELIDFYADQGHDLAIELKIEGLEEGVYGYDHDKNAAQLFINILVNKGYKNAIYHQLESGENLIYIHELINNFVEEGDEKAIRYKLHGYSTGKYGYAKNLEEARKLNEQFVTRGSQKAIFNKIVGCIEEKYGYQKEIQTAQKLIDELIAHNHEESIELKLIGLLEGKYGYSKDWELAHSLIENKIEEDNNFAIDLKINNLLGKCSKLPVVYKENSIIAQEFIDTLVDRKNEKAIEYKIQGYLYGHLNCYKRDIHATRETIEVLVLQKNSCAIIRKVAGLKYGIFGFDMNKEQAINFARIYNAHPYLIKEE